MTGESLSGAARGGRSEVKCANCGEYPGTERFTKDGGVMAFVHGDYSMWCQGCVTEAQLTHAKLRAALIPTLERSLAKWRATHPTRGSAAPEDVPS